MKIIHWDINEVHLVMSYREYFKFKSLIKKVIRDYTGKQPKDDA